MDLLDNVLGFRLFAGPILAINLDSFAVGVLQVPTTQVDPWILVHVFVVVQIFLA